MNLRQTALVMMLSLAAYAGLPSLAAAQQTMINGVIQDPSSPSASKILTNGVDQSPASASATPPPAVAETAYDRVVRTGILHCGYYLFTPLVVRDPKSGVLSGLGIDMMDVLAANAGLKVEWIEEVDFASWGEGLKAGRFDALCTPTWPDTSIARAASYTRPLFYAATGLYARGGDTRFDENADAANNPAVTIAVAAGSPQAGLAQSRFPQAHLLPLPANMSGQQVAAYVVGKKADLMLWDDGSAYDYLKTYPGSLHNIAPDHPLRAMPFELAVALGDDRLRDLLDTGLQNLQDNGYTDQLIDRWERAPGTITRVARPYEVPPASAAIVKRAP